MQEYYNLVERKEYLNTEKKYTDRIANAILDLRESTFIEDTRIVFNQSYREQLQAILSCDRKDAEKSIQCGKPIQYKAKLQTSNGFSNIRLSIDMDDIPSGDIINSAAGEFIYSLCVLLLMKSNNGILSITDSATCNPFKIADITLLCGEIISLVQNNFGKNYVLLLSQEAYMSAKNGNLIDGNKILGYKYYLMPSIEDTKDLFVVGFDPSNTTIAIPLIQLTSDTNEDGVLHNNITFHVSTFFANSSYLISKEA